MAKLITRPDSNTLRILDIEENGQIVEEGSNSNGKWTKWSSGLMTCYWEGVDTAVDQGPSGGLYYKTGSWTYPQAFVGDVPVVAISGSDLASGIFWATTAGNPGLTGLTWELVGTNVGTARPSAIAVGRWK